MAKELKKKENRTKDFFLKLTKRIFIIIAPNIWYENFRLPEIFLKIHSFVSKLSYVLMGTFVLSEWGALYTQNQLSEKQTADLSLFAFSHGFLYTYVINLDYHKEKVKRLLLKLTVNLKEVYNDRYVERQMIKKSKFYSVLYIFIFSTALVFYGIDALLQVLTKDDATFTTVITAWPNVKDLSRQAGVGRVTSYFLWWFFMIRVSTVYVLMIPITICLSHQYKNLTSYFNSLNEIFEERLSPIEKEMKYEEGFKVGIKLHSDTLWCTKQTQEIFSLVFGGQIIVNTTVLVLLMSQMMNSERTLSNTAAILSTVIAMLTSTGCFMWNAGDVTVDASITSILQAALVPMAMFCSGWHHCRTLSSRRVKTLLVIGIAASQNPVELRCLGIMKLSYNSYLSIVKSAYSVFSVLY